MAKPAKTNTRFNRIERDLHRALSMPVFHGYEQVVLQVAQELSYTVSAIDGSHKPKWFTIHVSRLAERRGLQRESLSRAITVLLKDEVLVGNRDCMKINKRYRQWKGKHVLTPRQIAECADALLAPVTTCGESFTFPPKTVVKTGTHQQPLCDVDVTSCILPVTSTSQKCDVHVTAPVTSTSQPLSKCAPVRESKERGENPPHPPKGEVCVTDACGEEKPWIGDLQPDLAELARVEAKAEALFPGCYFDQKARQFATSYPLAWIDRAIEEAAASGKRVGWKYIHGILQRWQTDGGPPPLPRTGKGRLPAPAPSQPLDVYREPDDPLKPPISIRGIPKRSDPLRNGKE